MSLRSEATAWTVSSSSLSSWTGRGLTATVCWLGVRDPPPVRVESTTVRSVAGRYSEHWCVAETSWGSSTPPVPSPSSKVEVEKEVLALCLLFSSISMRESRLSESSRRPPGEAMTGEGGNSVMHGWYARWESVLSSVSGTPSVLRRRVSELPLTPRALEIISCVLEGKKWWEVSVGSPSEGREYSEHEAGCHPIRAPGDCLNSCSRGCGRKCLKMEPMSEPLRCLPLCLLGLR